jgi:hypothetical protein
MILIRQAYQLVLELITSENVTDVSHMEKGERERERERERESECCFGVIDVRMKLLVNSAFSEIQNYKSKRAHSFGNHPINLKTVCL